MPEENQAENLSTEITGATRSAETARALIRKTKRATRRRFPTEEKIRIVMEGVRGEVSVAELCRREGIHPAIYYKWLKDFMEAGKARMQGDSLREASSDEVKALRQENERFFSALTRRYLRRSSSPNSGWRRIARVDWAPSSSLGTPCSRESPPG